MREVDRSAIQGIGPNLFQMMENAGRNLAEEALARLGGSSGPVVVLAGSGGNGGGAICAGRHLVNHGLDVRLCLASPVDRLGEMPREQLAVFRATPGDELAPNQLAGLDAALVLEGLIGYGLRGAPRGTTAELIEWANATPALTISLDLPAGVEATSGTAPGAFVRADVTLTLALPKTGLARAPAGELILADIGIPAGVFESAGIAYASPFRAAYRVPLVCARPAD